MEALWRDDWYGILGTTPEFTDEDTEALESVEEWEKCQPPEYTDGDLKEVVDQDSFAKATKPEYRRAAVYEVWSRTSSGISGEAVGSRRKKCQKVADSLAKRRTKHSWQFSESRRYYISVIQSESEYYFFKQHPVIGSRLMKGFGTSSINDLLDYFGLGEIKNGCSKELLWSLSNEEQRTIQKLYTDTVKVLQKKRAERVFERIETEIQDSVDNVCQRVIAEMHEAEQKRRATEEAKRRADTEAATKARHRAAWQRQQEEALRAEEERQRRQLEEAKARAYAKAAEEQQKARRARQPAAASSNDTRNYQYNYVRVTTAQTAAPSRPRSVEQTPSQQNTAGQPSAKTTDCQQGYTFTDYVFERMGQAFEKMSRLFDKLFG